MMRLRRRSYWISWSAASASSSSNMGSWIKPVRFSRRGVIFDFLFGWNRKSEEEAVEGDVGTEDSEGVGGGVGENADSGGDGFGSVGIIARTYLRVKELD